MHCPRCATPVTVDWSPGWSATDGSVTLEVERTPTARCENGHDVDLIGPALSDVPVARGRRFRADRCAACSAALSLPSRSSTQSFSVPLDAGVLTLTVHGPYVRCGACAFNQLRAEAASSLSRLAVLHA